MRLLSTQIAASERLAIARERAEVWLRSGLEPRQLAFTLALGFAIGCIPVLGITTGLCAVLALIFGLNMPAIQAANWLAMPFQAVLLIPYLRLGQWLVPGNSHEMGSGLRIALDPRPMIAQAMAAPMHAVEQAGSLFGRALLAWSLTAIPALLVLTLLLTPVLHRLRQRTAVIQQN